jgi:hypothetical protein
MFVKILLQSICFIYYTNLKTLKMFTQFKDLLRHTFEFKARLHIIIWSDIYQLFSDNGQSKNFHIISN